MSFDNCLSNRPKTSSVFDIAWYKDDRGWENSRQLCKPETKTRVCITVDQFRYIEIHTWLRGTTLFFTPFFCRLFRLSRAPAICPWVYEDARLGGIKQKKSSWGSIRILHSFCFYSAKPQSQVWILIYRLISQPFECLHQAIHSFLYKHIFYKNIEAEICEILRIF